MAPEFEPRTPAEAELVHYYRTLHERSAALKSNLERLCIDLPLEAQESLTHSVGKSFEVMNAALKSVKSGGLPDYDLKAVLAAFKEVNAAYDDFVAPKDKAVRDLCNVIKLKAFYK